MSDPSYGHHADALARPSLFPRRSVAPNQAALRGHLHDARSSPITRELWPVESPRVEPNDAALASPSRPGAAAAVTQAWLSPAHSTYKGTEADALRNCRAIAPSTTPRSEYFPDLDFTTARRETVKAVLGVRDTARYSATTQAAGLHQPIPGHICSRLAPSVWDEYRRQVDYFRQGSQRSRFRRRHDALATRIRSVRVSGPESAFADAEIALPLAPVIALSSRCR
jgi:hypothetical protein